MIFVILLTIFTPISFAKEVSIPELFEVTKETTLTDSNKEVYFYIDSKLIASTNNELVYHYQNKLGSDINSKTLPFGQEIYNEERFSFAGKELDQELYYFNARYYDPELGRFTSVDPIPSEPAYQYVYNNPLRFTDPTGTQTGVEVALVEQALIGAEEAYMISEGSKLLQQGLTASPKQGLWAGIGVAAAGIGTFLTVMLWASPLNVNEDEELERLNAEEIERIQRTLRPDDSYLAGQDPVDRQYELENREKSTSKKTEEVMSLEERRLRFIERLNELTNTHLGMKSSGRTITNEEMNTVLKKAAELGLNTRVDPTSSIQPRHFHIGCGQECESPVHYKVEDLLKKTLRD